MAPWFSTYATHARGLQQSTPSVNQSLADGELAVNSLFTQSIVAKALTKIGKMTFPQTVQMQLVAAQQPTLGQAVL